MKNIKGVKIAAPILAVLLGGMSVQGCSDDPTESLGSCEASLEAKAEPSVTRWTPWPRSAWR